MQSRDRWKGMGEVLLEKVSFGRCMNLLSLLGFLRATFRLPLPRFT